MQYDRQSIKAEIIRLLEEFGDLDPDAVNDDTPLIGGSAAIKSRVVVELLLALEEFAEDNLGVVFDWTSDATFSENRSMLRTVGALADHLWALKSVA